MTLGDAPERVPNIARNLRAAYCCRRLFPFSSSWSACSCNWRPRSS